MNREYRSLEMSLPEAEEFRVDGYASTWEPYKLLELDGVDYNERIDRHAFDGADLTDVVFRVDHEGPVYARTSNGAINLSIDDHGFAHVTDLSKTARSKELYEEIRAGMYPKMSFAFTVAEDHYERDTHTRVIDRIAKVFDISAVSFPANPTTELSARDYFDGVIEMEKAERLEAEQRERQKKLLELKIKIGGI